MQAHHHDRRPAFQFVIAVTTRPLIRRTSSGCYLLPTLSPWPLPPLLSTFSSFTHPGLGWARPAATPPVFDRGVQPPSTPIGPARHKRLAHQYASEVAGEHPNAPTALTTLFFFP
ncbi:hypothetical protein NL676_005826 [Syzygium grande]|nr:hypothetical protein NL676_005826 [Syzygium grande]